LIEKYQQNKARKRALFYTGAIPKVQDIFETLENTGYIWLANSKKLKFSRTKAKAKDYWGNTKF